jgi:hypothetical protein
MEEIKGADIFDKEFRIDRAEVDKEVEEEYRKFLKEYEKNSPPKKKSINWYAILSLLIMAIGISSTIITIIQIITS